MRSAAIRRDGLLACLAGLLTLLYVWLGGGGFALDDSWIHQVYGRNLAQLGEWSFVAGVPSAASSSPLYTVLLSIGYRLNMPFMLWTHGMGALALAVMGILAARMTHWLLPQAPRVAWAAGIAQISTWHLLWSAASGMETALFSALTLALMALTWHVQRRFTGAYGLAWGVCGALVTLARPEGLGLVGLSGLVLALTWGWRGVGRLLVSGLVFVLVMLPYVSLNLALTGGLLPNTANAKFIQHAVLLNVPYPVRLWDLSLAILAGGQALLVIGTLAYGRYSWRSTPHMPRWQDKLALLLPAAWVVGLIALYAARLPAAYQHGRYVIPALPALVLMGVIGLAWWGEATRRSMLGRVLVRALSLSTILTYAYFLLNGALAYQTDVAVINEEMVSMAHYIRDYLSPDELLAIHDIGAVGYFAPRPMLDIAGLISPEVVPALGDAEALWALMQAQGARYLLAFPNQIPNRDPQDPRLCLLKTSEGATARRLGEANMALYRLLWQGETCSGT